MLLKHEPYVYEFCSYQICTMVISFLINSTAAWVGMGLTLPLGHTGVFHRPTCTIPINYILWFSIDYMGLKCLLFFYFADSNTFKVFGHDSGPFDGTTLEASKIPNRWILFSYPLKTALNLYIIHVFMNLKALRHLRILLDVHGAPWKKQHNESGCRVIEEILVDVSLLVLYGYYFRFVVMTSELTNSLVHLLWFIQNITC